MKILKIEMAVNVSTFKPEANVEVLVNVEELQDNYVMMTREQLAEWFLSSYETARAEFAAESQ